MATIEKVVKIQEEIVDDKIKLLREVKAKVLTPNSYLSVIDN